MNEYVIAFSSFYRAVYAKERLQENRIGATLKKVPPNLLKSCGYAMYLKTNNIDNALEVLDKNNINAKGIYQIEYNNGSVRYKQIA